MDWHRLFSLMLIDFFSNSPFMVEHEKDLSLHEQRLDIVILRKEPGMFPERLPDGLEDLADHNLLTFKSHQEALDDWALKELTGHYVNYRKQLSARDQPLLPESHFRLYAVCSRFPQGLSNHVNLEPVRPGVYECRRGTDVIRVIVAGQLPDEANNAALHLFSAAPQKVLYGATHYRQRSKEMSTLLKKLFRDYQVEGIKMPFTMEDLKRDFARELWQEMTPEERRDVLRGLSPQDILGALPPEFLETLRQQLSQENGAKSST